MPKVQHWNEAEDGPLGEAALIDKLERQGYSVNRYVYPPGTVFPPHTHEVDKVDAVLRGRFQLEMEGERIILEAGDSLDIPCGVVHSAEVVGDEPVVSLDAVRE
ncbi:MAG: cupin domain-containing protein [Pseudomonadota bacterium]|nr:cupin domain-containing protein [Pseudomonadota bacterium]